MTSHGGGGSHKSGEHIDTALRAFLVSTPIVGLSCDACGSLVAGSVVFDRYRLVERIGLGGSGEVWRAADLLLDQPVVLKRVWLAGVGHRAELNRKRALREARIAARLRHHRHVVTTYDVRIDDDDMWLVQEYLPARSLAQLLRELGPLHPGRASRIGIQLADALAAAHELGIEHRDVTPDNVLITDDGAARLTDFGISHLAGEPHLTRPGVISGTFACLAPETARTGVCYPSSDVFSLGCTLYAAIEGQPPWDLAGNTLEQLRVIGTGSIRPPTAAGAFTPFLLRLLELNPAARPDAATARDMLDQFCWGDLRTRATTVAAHPAATRLVDRFGRGPEGGP